MSMITLAQNGKKTVFCLERKPRGAVRAASSVAEDLRKITGAKPCDIRVAGESSPETGAAANADAVVVAGIVGSGSWIDEAQSRGLIDCSAIVGKRECYRIKTTQLEGGRTAVLVAGSDLLGLEYGLYKLSELCGVSPWHYFADVTPKKRESIELDENALDITSKEPSIKLRGFFMNDEWPSLGGWVHETFGGFNELFYEKVFDLLLRLKGNFLWPAMWSAVFSEDGKAYPTASAELADEYGIIMGTSHHEPLFRAGEEFSHTMTESNDKGYGADWNYHTNTRGIYEFWEYAVKRNRDFASLITMGMRGERDSKLLGENATLADNIELIKKTIIDQKKILSENGLADAPKVLALYKEVEDYFHGDETTEGLSKWEGLDDLMLLLSDDNYGNTRTLPTKENRDRAAGWGLYYHFDYHGGPISHEWVNSTPITKAWEQLTAAYQFGIKELWVANVGDLRPDELPLSYFLDLAYDFEKWSQPNKTGEWLEQWTRQQFGSCANEEVLSEIADILNEYTKMNGDCRPEATQENTFSFTEENEFERELLRAQQLDEKTRKTAESIPEELADAYFGLAGFPAMASANLRRMMILAGLQRRFYKLGISFANQLADEVEACIERDKALESQYNNEMAGGKWHHMMSSKHVAFQNWNDEGSDYPHMERLSLPKKGEVVAFCMGDDEAVRHGELTLPVFSNLEKNTADFFVAATGEAAQSHCVKASEAWIKAERFEIGTNTFKYRISIDWSALGSGFGEKKGNVRIRTLCQVINIPVIAKETKTENCGEGCFVESLGFVSMEAADYIAKHDADTAAWQFIENYGKQVSGSMKVLPADTFAENAETAPALEYSFFINNAGDYTLTAVIAPTNDPVKFKGQHFAVQLDENEPIIVNSLPEVYAAGDTDDANWCGYVLQNCRRCDLPLTLEAGKHSLKFIHLDAGIVLQKIEIAKEKSNAFYGRRPTFRTERS